MATKSRPDDRARTHIMPFSSCMVMAIPSSASAPFCAVLCLMVEEVGEMGEAYWAQSETAMVAWMRRKEAGRGDAVASSLPVGERRMRVCSWGLEEALRKVVRRFMRSIVWDMLSGVCGC